MEPKASYPKIAQLKSVADFRARLDELGLRIPVADRVLSADEGSPMAAPLAVGNGKGLRRVIGNRWCIHPMEGWDAHRDGSPSEHTLRRWRRFGASGAKLIWGGEAAAVRPDGRANPNQTLAIESNRAGLAAPLEACRSEHRMAFGSTDDLLVGLQLTHSGRFCRPDSHRLQPRIAYHHPLLDEKFGIDPSDDAVVWSDSDLERLIEEYVRAARLAFEVGFEFVDVKACHGYLLHEFLSARRRPGKFGGDFEGRTRLLLSIIDAIQESVPDLLIGVRLSVFDAPPFQTSREVGQPMPYRHLLPYDCGFGVDPAEPMNYDLREPVALLKLLKQRGVFAANLTCGSPYYNPHMQRPAIFPPSDGYQPPEDPLVGVARQIEAHRRCRVSVSRLPMIGTAYSYLQDYLPHVAQAVVGSGQMESVGLGRMVLSYPTLPADTLAGRPLQRKLVCRTFSDCTTGPRNGLISGCYPLDAHYKTLPENERLKELKQQMK
jgi:NADPH2 dehydrogenase